MRAGFWGKLDVAVIEVTLIKEDGKVVPSSSVGNNHVYLEMAEKIILEVNSWQSVELEGMHDIYNLKAEGHNKPIPISHPGDRIGSRHYDIDFDRVAAVVLTDAPDRNTPFKDLDEDSLTIARHRSTSSTWRSRRTPAQEPAAPAVGCGQHRQRGSCRSQLGHSRT